MMVTKGTVLLCFYHYVIFLNSQITAQIFRVNVWNSTIALWQFSFKVSQIKKIVKETDGNTLSAMSKAPGRLQIEQISSKTLKIKKGN